MIKSFFDPGIWPLTYNYIALNEEPTRWNYPSLVTPFWRVYWNNTAGASILIGKHTMPLLPSHLYIIPPNVDFGTTHHGNCRHFYIHFQIRHPYTLRSPEIISLPLSNQRRYFVRSIIACHNRGETGHRKAALLIRALLEMVAADLTDRHLVFRQVDTRLMNALSYLEQHLAQPIDNRQLAALMHLHPQTLLRLFKSELGKAPQEYLRQMRVDRACFYLRFSDEAIKAISEKTGFCDRYHFTKVFIQAIGQSPVRFRRYK